MERKTIVTIAFLVAALFVSSAYVYPYMRNFLSGWSDPVVTPAEIKAAEWAYDNVPHQKIFACDLFACEMLTAVAFEVGSVGGSWELVDDAAKKYSDNELVFMTNSSLDAYQILRNYGIDYVFVDYRSSFYAYGWKFPVIDKFSDTAYFEKIYDKDGAFIFRVRK